MGFDVLSGCIQPGEGPGSFRPNLVVNLPGFLVDCVQVVSQSFLHKVFFTKLSSQKAAFTPHQIFAAMALCMKSKSRFEVGCNLRRSIDKSPDFVMIDSPPIKPQWRALIGFYWRHVCRHMLEDRSIRIP